MVFFHHYSVIDIENNNNEQLIIFVLAIIPMSEYSTMEHVLHLHDNHSEQLSVSTSDEYQSPVYTHVENFKATALTLPFTLGNITKVKCSPRFSLRKSNE